MMIFYVFRDLTPVVNIEEQRRREKKNATGRNQTNQKVKPTNRVGCPYKKKC